MSFYLIVLGVLYGGVDMLSQETIEKALVYPDFRVRCAAVGNCKGNTNLSLDFIGKLRKSQIPFERQAAMLACINNRKASIGWLFDGLDDSDFLVKEAAVKAFRRRSDIPLRDVKTLLFSDQWYRRYAGINACVGRQMSVETIKNWAGFSVEHCLPSSFHAAAAAACIGNYVVPYRLVERILCESNLTLTKLLAAEAFGRIYVPTDKIVNMLHHSDRFVQMAGLYAYRTESAIPHVDIGDKLISDDMSIRRLASKVCDKNRLTVLRNMEPPARVYKKCVGGVVLVASIPKDAQIRGNVKMGYRADRAAIKDLYGDFCGESVGISLYDHSVDYRIGQEVLVDDFDFGYESMSCGFHFFTNIYQAEAY